MTWVRLDDLLPHHRKLMACGSQAATVFGYYAASIAFANRQFTDGVILPADLPLLIPAVPRPKGSVLEALVQVGLWDARPEGGWVIHDFLEWNRSAAYRKAKWAADAKRKRRGVLAESNGSPSGVQVESDSIEPKPKQSLSSTAFPPRLSRKKDSEGSGWRPTARRLLEFLNERAEKHFEPVDSNLRLLEALLKDSRTEAQIRGVIVKKCRDWLGDPKTAEWLRPKTLFNKTNFAQYRGEIPHEERDAELPGV